jgi:hypothetical protein
MQSTTTATDAPARGRRRHGSVAARLDSPLWAAAISLGAWLAFVLARLEAWAHGRLSLFIMSGVKKYSHPGRMSPLIAHVPITGYDGQFYYRLAMGPFNWRREAYGIAMDYAYRYTRLGYPLLAWVLSLGRAQWLPVVLVAVNLACMAVIGWLGGSLARSSGRHALCGLLLAGYFGMVISVGRDTAEPLADALMLGGLLLLRRERWLLATTLITGAAVTNETTLILPLALLLTRLYPLLTALGTRPLETEAPRAAASASERGQARARAAKPDGQTATQELQGGLGGLVFIPPGKRDLAWLVPGCAYLALQVVERLVVRWQAAASADAARNLGLPFQGMERGLRADAQGLSWSHLGAYDINLIEFIALAAIVLAGLAVLRSTTAPPHERLAFLGFVLVEMVLATWQFWGSTFGDGRSFGDAYLLAVVMLLATPAAGARPALPSRRLAMIAAVVVAALIVVARRRILFE